MVIQIILASVSFKMARFISVHENIFKLKLNLLLQNYYLIPIVM